MARGRHAKPRPKIRRGALAAFLVPAVLSGLVTVCIPWGSTTAATDPPHQIRHTHNTIVVTPESVERARPAPMATVIAKPKPTSILVRDGDNLSDLAQRYYGDRDRWPSLWYVNRHKIHNPEVISVGQKLKLSDWHPKDQWIARLAEAAIPKPPKPKSAPERPQEPSSAPIPVEPTPNPALSQDTSGLATSAFEACVIMAESGGDPTAQNPKSTASGLYGFLLTTWMSTPYGSQYPGGAKTAPPSVQHQAFLWLYARDGVSPWRPYDGC